MTFWAQLGINKCSSQEPLPLYFRGMLLHLFYIPVHGQISSSQEIGSRGREIERQTPRHFGYADLILYRYRGEILTRINTLGSQAIECHLGGYHSRMNCEGSDLWMLYWGLASVLGVEILSYWRGESKPYQREEIRPFEYQ